MLLLFFTTCWIPSSKKTSSKVLLPTTGISIAEDSVHLHEVITPYKGRGVVLWLGGCVSLPCSVDIPSREPIHPESWEDNSRGHRPSGSGWPGQARLKVSSKQTGSNLSNSLHLPSPAPFVFPLEENFNWFCIGKKKNTLFGLENYQCLKLK